ncbi:MAG: MarR family transcriptional regulator [Gammaproteobacteria bacterium]|nr:MarR family transcriptional regulator [Gammaproteobacteria bacterium]
MLHIQEYQSRVDDSPFSLEHSTGHLIKVAHRSFQQSLQAHLAVHGVKLSHWHCLRYLWEEDGLTQRELSKRVYVQESTIVAVIREMESIGLIRRIRSTDDRRKYAVRLTAKAKRITKQLLPVARKVNDLGTATFSRKEIKLFHDMTLRVIANLESSMPPER